MCPKPEVREARRHALCERVDNAGGHRSKRWWTGKKRAKKRRRCVLYPLILQGTDGEVTTLRDLPDMDRDHTLFYLQEIFSKCFFFHFSLYGGCLFPRHQMAALLLESQLVIFTSVERKYYTWSVPSGDSLSYDRILQDKRIQGMMDSTDIMTRLDLVYITGINATIAGWAIHSGDGSICGVARPAKWTHSLSHVRTMTRRVCLPARRRSAYGVGRRQASSVSSR